MKRLFSTAIVMSISIGSLYAQHTGPDYGNIPTNTVRDDGSRTFDNARHSNYTVTWNDRYNQKHTVNVPAGQTITVCFPIASGGSWIWYDSDVQRTGFNPAVTWVEAIFWRDGDHVRMQSTGYRVGPPDQGLLGEIKDRVKDISELATLGAKTSDEGLRIAKAAGLLK